MEESEAPARALVRELEQRLLRPDVRSSAEEVARLLADEFVETGSSGRVLDKEHAIEALRDEQAVGRSAVRTADDFAVRSIAENVCLVTYRAVSRASDGREEFETRRSSIWKLIDGRWQMIFHQGTPVRPTA